jgi:CRP-like cAMP-binding protein
MAGIVLVEKLILGKNWGLLTMEKGAFFSREGLGEGRRQSYGVKCLTEVKLLAIEAKELHKFCQEIS